MRISRFFKRSLALYFILTGLLSIVLVTAMYALFMSLWDQLLVTYKTEYLDDQSLKMAHALHDRISGGKLTDREAAWFDSLSRQYAGSIRYTDSTGENVRFDNVNDTGLVNPYAVELPLILDGRLVGNLSVHFDLDRDNYFPYFTNMNKTAKQYAQIIYVGLLVAALLLSYGLAYKLSKPLRDGKKHTAAVLIGNFEAAVPPAATSEQAELHQTINYLLNEFQQQEKWRKQLMQDLTHELRTPLTSVLSRLEAMIDGIYPLNVTNMNKIYTEIDRLSRLVKDVEKLSEAEGARFTLNVQKVDLVQLLKSVHESFLFLAQDKRISFELQPVYFPCYIQADPDRMIQVLSNVISNAIKYTPQGGAIEMGLTTDDETTVIYCTDNGIGISKEDLPYVFNRFYRADKSRSRESGGLGVGLSIARVLVDAHGGSMDVRSELAKGSTFTIRLPAMPRMERQAGEMIAI